VFSSPSFFPMSKYSGPEWSDIARVREDDSDGVCVISYSADYVELMDVFRGVVSVSDYSRRVLPLLTDLLSHNPANYSVWHYRRLVIASLAASLSLHDEKQAVYQEELAFVSEVAEAHPKNYQIWYHRQVIVTILFPQHDKVNAQKELDFLATIFDDDAKNYHAWSYRQWVLTYYGLWDNEPHFVDTLITSDIRNNSAWNQRFFVFSKGTTNFSDPAVLKQEIKSVLLSFFLLSSTQ